MESINMEQVSIVLSASLCLVVFLNILVKLRKVFPYRVNCWFCNTNCWVVFPERNSWSCRVCDQYNGFTKDGDYNRPLSFPTSENKVKSRKSRIISNNGLCKMCNVNQQLKVAQLANFVPINEKNFDAEIDTYRSQLEKAYKLCSLCTKHLKSKLHKEKQTLLNLRLIKSKTPDKANQSGSKEERKKSRMMRRIYMIMTLLLIFLIVYGLYKDIQEDAALMDSIIQTYQVALEIFGDIKTMMKNWIYATYPRLQDYENIEITFPVIEIPDIHLDIDPNMIPDVNFETIMKHAVLIQRVVCGVGLILHMICHCLNVDIVDHRITAEILWSFLVIGSTIIVKNMMLHTKIFNLIVTLILFSFYKKVKIAEATSPTKKQKSPKSMKNLVQAPIVSSTAQHGEETSSESETDDDVSLSKFGINNSHSSSDGHEITSGTLYDSKIFSPNCTTKNNSFWNSTLRKNNLNSNQIKYQTATRKPKFAPKGYGSFQNDSDSDIDESISGLHLGSSPKKFAKQNGVFQMKQFCSTIPGFATPLIMPVSQRRPLISPGKLGKGTSWVAGGYWGSDSARPAFDTNGTSRSSSQSSGFESQASSANMRNLFSSQPPSREDSVNRDIDRMALISDPFQKHHKLVHTPSDVWSNNSRLKSPVVHPQMKFDSHINIPQVQNEKLFTSLSSLSISNYNLRGRNTSKQSLGKENSFVGSNYASPLIKLPNVPESMDC